MSDKKKPTVEVVIGSTLGTAGVTAIVNTRKNKDGQEVHTAVPSATSDTLATELAKFVAIIPAADWLRSQWSLIVDAFKNASFKNVAVGEDGNATVNVEELSKAFFAEFAPGNTGKKQVEILKDAALAASTALQEFFAAHPDCMEESSPNRVTFLRLLQEAGIANARANAARA